MALYDTPTRYNFGAVNFGTTDVIHYVKADKGGWIWDAGIFGVTTALVGTTSTPGIKIGTDADAQAYVKPFSYGAATVAGGGISLRSAMRAGSPQWNAIVVKRRVPKGSVIKITHVAGVGTPAGLGFSYFDIVWDK